MFEFIMNKWDDEKYREIATKPNFQKKLNMTKLLPWITININFFIQITSFVFIIIIKKRIKLKSDYGISIDIQTHERSCIRNPIDNNQNIEIFPDKNNGNKLIKYKKLKSGKNHEKQENIISNQNSELLNMKENKISEEKNK